MAEATTNLEVKSETKVPTSIAAPQRWEPLESLRREVDRLFDSFGDGWWRRPFARPALDLELAWPKRTDWMVSPAVDVADKDSRYEITAELPGLDEKDVDVSVANGTLTIKGEKRDEKEEKEEDYYLSERRYGSFQRSFRLPDGADADKIEARFSKGVLTVTIPKTPEAKQSKRKISIKSA